MPLTEYLPCPPPLCSLCCPISLHLLQTDPYALQTDPHVPTHEYGTVVANVQC